MTRISCISDLTIKYGAGTTDLWISSDIESVPIMAEAGARQADYEAVYTISEASSYIMISAGSAVSTIERWQKAFEALRKGSFGESLAETWSKELGLRFAWYPEKGIVIVKQ